MEHRIVEKPSYQVIGKAKRVSCKDGENFKTIPAFWGEVTSDSTFDRLLELTSEGGVLGDVTLGICMEFADDMQEFTYLIGVEKKQDSVPDGLVEKEVPAATWAVFEAIGPLPGSIQAIFGKIFSEFFPTSDYEHAPGGPEVEVYPAGNPHDENYKCEVWVPVIKKS